jgi:acetoin:2,6-dichlorophenolindophenol oxidoreductase subunit beta
MEITLRETIKHTVANHLNNGFLAFGQCLTAVGWVGGTLPEMYEDQGMIELSMADVAGGAFVVGAGLMQRKPIYVIRYQGFNWYNSVSIINYACKSKELWDKPCPIFIRSIAMEGSIGPVAGSSHHSLYYRMPGVKIYSPMTSNEYKQCYNDFMNSDDVFYVSEHRGSYSNDKELEDIVFFNPDCILFPISITRFAAVEASKILLEQHGIKVSVYHQKILKPYQLNPQALHYLSKCNLGIVIDDDYEDGIASNIAHKLMINSNSKVFAMGLKNKSAGFANHLDNLPPSSVEICSFIKRILKNKGKV